MPIFDHEYKVFLIPSILNRASVDNDAIIIESSDIDDKKIISKSITDLYRSLAEKKINEIFLGAFNTVFPGSDNVPKIKIRKMTSMWGNCCPCKNTITFNIFLSALPEECIEYLVYHEIVHLIHADHSKDFYDTLERFLPNWKERKNKMRRYNEITRIF